MDSLESNDNLYRQLYSIDNNQRRRPRPCSYNGRDTSDLRRAIDVV